MNYFYKKRLEIIAQEAEVQEQSAKRIKRAIRDILMFEVGAAYYDYMHSNCAEAEAATPDALKLLTGGNAQ